MWFLGLIIGGIIGAIGGERGALLGAMVGAGVGWALSRKLRGAGDERLEKLETAIRLQQRVTFLENERRTTVRVETAPAAEPREPARADSLSVIAPPAPPDTTTPPDAPTSIAVPQESEPVAAIETSAPAFAREPRVTRQMPPSTPAQPSALWDFFFGGNTLVRFGVIVSSASRFCSNTLPSISRSPSRRDLSPLP